ncbi:MAG: acetate--CoA ligase family protein, partial [Candidatus Omnitrophota bacterium]
EQSEALAAATDMGYPVVLKVCAADMAHKTEQGLIALGITNEADLERAFEELHARAEALGGRLLVQEMVHGAREVVMGMIRDPQFGPCVMFGLGGIFAEALDDVSFRVAPLSAGDSLEMTSEIRGHKILSDIRGIKAVDTEVLCHCLRQLGQLALDHPAVREIDINPMIIRDSRPLAVDALIVLDKPQSQIRTDTWPKSGVGLKIFFEPKSVAILGASKTPHKAGNDVIKNILANDFHGNLYLVNPKGGEILGHKVSTSVQEPPPDSDLAIIILPAAVTPQAIRDCAARGIKGVVLAAGGFAEVDESGKQLQEDTLTAIRDTGIRAIGPNTSGHISTPHNFTSSFFPLGKIPRGNIAYIAQTGNFATHTMRYIMSAENYGVSRVTGLGNKLDVEESEVLEYYAQDPETEAILIYLESFKRPRRFMEVARQVTRTKPVILLKGGATEKGAHAAVAHTAALASDDRIIDAALRQAGVVRVYKYSHLILVAKALAFMPLPKGNRAAILAPSGAMLVCLTDLCNRYLKIDVARLEEKTRQRLQDISTAYIRMRNPVDIWPSAAVHGVEYAYREGMEAVLNDKNIDAVTAILMLTDETGVPPLDFIVELKERHPHKPIYITFSGEKKHMDAAKAFLEPRGVPTFNFIEEPIEVLDILAQCRYSMERS